MSDEKFNVEDSYKCVRKLGDLGTGRHGRSVLVGDSEDPKNRTLQLCYKYWAQLAVMEYCSFRQWEDFEYHIADS